MTRPLLEVRSLSVTFRHAAEARPALDDVSFSLGAGESVGIVGASGAGKSTLGAALLRLLPDGAEVAPRASIGFEGDDLLRLGREEMRRRRGRRIALVPQEPMQALDPCVRVGAQLAEALTAHGLASASEARARVVEMLSRVGFPDPGDAVDRHAHEFSGGMRQRLLIAAALLPAPALVIADEPTTALDATIQAQVLDLLDALRRETGTTLLLISHDLDVVGERCGRILVMDRGRMVEDGSAAQVIAHPVSAAARALTAARAGHRRAAPPPSTRGAPVLAGDAISVRYHDRRRRRGAEALTAVRGVSLALHRAEVVAIVGESGSGKSSLALALLRLVASEGRITLDGRPLPSEEGEPLRRLRKHLQWVPQDAGAALTPQLTVGALVREGLEVHGLAHGAPALTRAEALLAEVGLDPALSDRRPAELSSGQRQRVAIARALATDPDVLVCDEPMAAVDPVTRDRIIDLLDRLRAVRGLAILLISHDLASVRRLADRVMVMYLGRVVESATASALFDAPQMPYTQALLAAVPTGDPAALRTRVLPVGEPPSPSDPPTGCPFHPRCPSSLKDEQCRTAAPPLVARPDSRAVACWKA